jgi:hypothetical protein
MEGSSLHGTPPAVAPPANFCSGSSSSFSAMGPPARPTIASSSSADGMLFGRPGSSSSSDATLFMRPALARSPPPPYAGVGPSAFGSGPLAFLDGLAGPMQAAADNDRSLPPTPRSPSPTCSPPGSPKRQKSGDAKAVGAPGSEPTLEDDLETRAAALGLNEVTQRVWKETALPPTPSSPSPTFSPPSSPKQRRAAELTAAHAAVKLAESLRAECEAQSLARGGDSLSFSDSEGGQSSAMALERQAAVAEWEASERSSSTFGGRSARSPGPSSSVFPSFGEGRRQQSSSSTSRKKRVADGPL